MVVGLLGILKAGGAYLPLDPDPPAERLAFILEDAGAPVLVANQRSVINAGSHPHRAAGRRSPENARQPETAPLTALYPANTAYMIYTSGSTGAPKGAAKAHGALANLISGARTHCGRTGTAIAQLTPITFDVSAQENSFALMTGKTLFVASDDMRRDPAALSNWLRT